MSSNIVVVLVWTVCSLVASFGCRCGTLHDAPSVPGVDPPHPAYNPFDPAQSPVVSRRARIDAIKTDILGKLGVDEVEVVEPAANVTTDERRRVIRLYRQSVDQLRGKTHRLPGELKQLGTAKRFFSFSALQPDNGEGGSRSRRNRGRLHVRFDVDLPSSGDGQTQLVVKSATLRLFKRRVRRRRLRPTDRLRVNVLQLLRDSTTGSRKRLIDSRLIETSADDDGTWEEFDVLRAVAAWTDNPTTNRGLTVEAELEDGIGRVRLSRVVEFVGPSSSDSGPTLSVMTRQRPRRRRRRQRRSTGDITRQHDDCRRGDGETRCCRYPLWVSFREIGWDRWILAPDGYRAYYCDGACPPRHRVATHYAGIRALVNGVRPDAAPPPCCAATRMTPLTIAHYNRDGRAVVSVFDDMIVDECMCT